MSEGFFIVLHLEELNIIGVLYLIIGLVATIFGALAGLGGGVIIKPVLDLLGHYDVVTISILSAATVLAMSSVSLLNSIKSDIKLNVKTSLKLASGSVAGGLVGKTLFNYIVKLIDASDLVTAIQAAMIGLFMVAIYIFIKHREKMNMYQLQNSLLVVSIGFILGLLAAFLGIGGGPFNVAILALCFSMGPKESSLNSIFIIWFSQISALLLIAFTSGFSQFDLSMLFFMIPGGIVGGYLGSRLLRLINDKIVEKIFMVGIIVIILINAFNVVRYFI